MRNAAKQTLVHDAPVIAMLGASALLVCVLLLFIALPQWHAYKDKAMRIGHYDKYISSSAGFDAVRLRLESKNEELAFKLAEISPSASPRSLPDVLHELISRGKECGVTLLRIQPQTEVKSADGVYTPVLLETSADYLKIGKYVASIETLPQTLLIRKVAIDVARSGELSVRLLVNCHVNGRVENVRPLQHPPQRQNYPAASAADVIPEYDVSEQVSSALEAKIVAPIAEFNPSAGAPFRAFGSYASVAPSSHKPPAGETKVKTRRLPFILRGIMRDPSYAIIEDARGETHIKARGELIHNAQIISVNNNSVFLKDSSGIHELTVEESR